IGHRVRTATAASGTAICCVSDSTRSRPSEMNRVRPRRLRGRELSEAALEAAAPRRSGGFVGLEIRGDKSEQAEGGGGGHRRLEEDLMAPCHPFGTERKNAGKLSDRQQGSKQKRGAQREPEECLDDGVDAGLHVRTSRSEGRPIQ